MSNASQEVISGCNSATVEVTVSETEVDKAPESLTTSDRKTLIQRMLREALDEPSAVAANLQINGGDLLEMSLVLKTAIMDAAKSSRDIAELKDLQSFVDTYVKLSRQADRILRLKHEITQTPRSSSLVVGKSGTTGE